MRFYSIKFLQISVILLIVFLFALVYHIIKDLKEINQLQPTLNSMNGHAESLTQKAEILQSKATKNKNKPKSNLKKYLPLLFTFAINFKNSDEKGPKRISKSAMKSLSKNATKVLIKK